MAIRFLRHRDFLFVSVGCSVELQSMALSLLPPCVSASVSPCLPPQQACSAAPGPLPGREGSLHALLLRCRGHLQPGHRHPHGKGSRTSFHNAKHVIRASHGERANFCVKWVSAVKNEHVKNSVLSSLLKPISLFSLPMPPPTSVPQRHGSVRPGEDVAIVQSGRQPIWRSESTHHIQVRRVRSRDEN